MKVKPQVSVCVCHHKGPFIYKFVDSVKKSEGVDYEIIVVTSDGELAGKGIPGCFVINGPQMPAAKRNMGARLANTNYLAFFDDDVEIDKNCLYEMYQTLKHINHVGMVYGKLHKADEPTRFDEAGGYLTSTGFIWSRAGQNIVDEGQFDKLESIFAGKSASCMIKKHIFEKVKGFDEDFEILGEESDLSWRVWLYGYEVWFEPSATGIHYFNTKFKPAKEYYTSKRVHFNGCRNYTVMLLKNLETYNLWKILPIHVLAWSVASISMILTGKFGAGINILKGLSYVIIKLPYILEKRRKVQDKRVVTDEQLWPYIFRRPPKGYYTQRFFRYLSIGLHG